MVSGKSGGPIIGDIGPGSVAALRDPFAIARVRLLPMLFVLYAISYLDRINIGFASLTMNKELAISSEQYGMLAGIFFFGYFLLEVPSNLILHRVGARVWIARILLTWGAVSLLTGFVENATQLYIARFLLGAAEAGLFPGLLLYLTYWLPQRQQAAAVALFMTALPVASIVGGPVSGWILDHVAYYGLSSWRWLLIVEAVPALVCGVLTYYLLPSHPAEARFLTTAEKDLVKETLHAEAVEKMAAGDATAIGPLKDPRIWQLAACSFLFLTGLYVTGFWMPQAIRKLAIGQSFTNIGLLVMAPNIVGLVAMALVSRNKRYSERRWHSAAPLLLAGAAYLSVGSVRSVPAALLLWCAVASGLYCFLGPFWSRAAAILTGRSAASGLAFINSLGNLGGFFGLPIVGWVSARTGSLQGGFSFVACGLLVGAVLMLCLPDPTGNTARSEVIPVAS